jgi:hypothetical protein
MPSHGHSGSSLGGRTDSAYGTSSHQHDLGYSATASIASANPGPTYNANLGSHAHDVNAHSHPMGAHTHNIDKTRLEHTHDVNVPSHAHTVADHLHGLVYGIYEEAGSPVVHFHVDNGSGFGAASGNYSTNQLDVDITALIAGAGWKSVRFDATARCRIAVIIECKLDITA